MICRDLLSSATYHSHCRHRGILRRGWLKVNEKRERGWITVGFGCPFHFDVSTAGEDLAWRYMCVLRQGESGRRRMSHNMTNDIEFHSVWSRGVSFPCCVCKCLTASEMHRGGHDDYKHKQEHEPLGDHQKRSQTCGLISS